MPVKYLYLDFDGVLHPNSFEKGKAFCLMPLLELALNGSDVRIVVSSSWRHHETQAYIQSLFPASIRSLLSGFTGELWQVVGDVGMKSLTMRLYMVSLNGEP